MSGRWALVTAGAQGLGRAISEDLLELGFDLFVHYHESSDAAREIEAKAAARGLRAVGLEADLREAAARERLMAEVAGRAAALSLLVNNLGVYPEVQLTEMDIGTWEDTFRLTCTTAFHLTQLALPLLLRAERARVVNIGDAESDRVAAHPEATAYYVAKLGVHLLTRTYAQLLTPRGITVNMVSPGFLVNSVGLPGNLPAGRPGAFADITRAIRFLISDDAEYVSGANLVVSGAWGV